MKTLMRSLVLIFSISLAGNLTARTGNKSDGKNLRANADRIEARILQLSEFGKNPEGGVSRVAFSQADIQGREYVMSLMREAGLKVRIDAAGNILGRKEGLDSNLPPIVFGSHIDSVPGGGNYDGDVGVIGSIECAQVLHENNFTTRHPLEVVVFSDEEGGLVGSRAMIGKLTPDALEVVSHSGKTIREGIRAIGGNPDKLSEALREKKSIKAFIELHIEQGSFLDDKKIEIGVVEGIVGINWWDVTIEGFANHAGTTPMNKRHDAMLAAAHLIVSVNEIATSIPGRQVATVGRIKAEPGAPNVIPGRVVMSLEIRDLSSQKMDLVFEKIQKKAKQIAKQTGTKISFSFIDVAAVPAPTDKRMRKIIAEAAGDLGLSFQLMPSGAGHDAQDIARITPTGMIFVPSVGGISHSPKEFTEPQGMANGANVLLQAILKIDEGALELTQK
ncbi:Zn-dependent hydrolase [candidate division KSB1 bacterium]|nr:Zn-dependent hydrolase [candidate division KSB1 bacterium]